MKSLKLKMISALSTGLLALTMGSGEVLAEDGKTYPASFCQQANHLFAQFPYGISAGEWINDDNFTTVIQCPIIKDSIGQGLKKGFIRVLDRNPSSDVRCTLISRRTHVHPDQGFTINVSSSGSSSFVQTLNFGAIGHNGSNTTYNLSCSVPGKANGLNSKLMGYYIEENS